MGSKFSCSICQFLSVVLLVVHPVGSFELLSLFFVLSYRLYSSSTVSTIVWSIQLTNGLVHLLVAKTFFSWRISWIPSSNLIILSSFSLIVSCPVSYLSCPASQLEGLLSLKRSLICWLFVTLICFKFVKFSFVVLSGCHIANITCRENSPTRMQTEHVPLPSTWLYLQHMFSKIMPSYHN